MPTRRDQRSEDSYIYHDILPAFEEYGYPERGDTENLKIKSIRIRIGRRYYTPDVVYYAWEVPVVVVEAKKPGMSMQDAEDQVKSYIRNFPVQQFSRDGIPPRYAAVTVGRQIYVYRYHVEINQQGAIVDRLEPLPTIPDYLQLLFWYGLVARKPVIDPSIFKIVFYELVSSFDLQNRKEVTPKIVLQVVQLLCEFLKDNANYVKYKPYTDLGRHPHIQAAIRSIMSQFDWRNLTPDVALRFREIVVRAFQGRKNLNQYVTPWPVVKFMTELAEIKPSDKVLDFECGSGGYLAAALAKGVPLRNLKGVDIADLPYFTARLFLALYSNTKGTSIDTNIAVYRDNGLYDQGDDWDVVISNPAGSNKYYLRDLDQVYLHLERELGQRGRDDGAWEYNFSVQQAVRSAKVGGRICLVLPEGFFSNSQAEFLRKFVTKHCAIRAVISLPRGVFSVGRTVKTVTGGVSSSSQKMSILYAVKVKDVTRGAGLDYDENKAKYPVFLASVSKPRRAGRGDQWLKDALDTVLAKYRKWASGK